MICAKPYCQSERWRGPNGTNDKLTLCEFHQKEDWRRYKAAAKPKQPPTPAIPNKNASVQASTQGQAPRKAKPKKIKAVQAKEQPKPVPKPVRHLLYDPRDGSLKRVEVRVLGDLPVRTYDPADLIALYRAIGASTIHILGDLGLQVDNTELIDQLGKRLAELKERAS